MVEERVGLGLGVLGFIISGCLCLRFPELRY